MSIKFGIFRKSVKKIQESLKFDILDIDDPWKLDGELVPKRWFQTISHRVITLKSEEFSSKAEETYSLIYVTSFVTDKNAPDIFCHHIIA